MQYSWETRISYDKDNDNNMNTDFWRYRYGDWSKTYSSSSIFGGDEHPAISAILGFTTVPAFWPVATCKFLNRLSITCHHFVRNPGSGTRGQDHCTDQAAEPSLEPKSFGRCRPGAWSDGSRSYGEKKSNGPMEEWGLLWIYYGYTMD